MTTWSFVSNSKERKEKKKYDRNMHTILRYSSPYSPYKYVLYIVITWLDLNWITPDRDHISYRIKCITLYFTMSVLSVLSFFPIYYKYMHTFSSSFWLLHYNSVLLFNRVPSSYRMCTVTDIAWKEEEEATKKLLMRLERYMSDTNS